MYSKLLLNLPAAERAVNLRIQPRVPGGLRTECLHQHAAPLRLRTTKHILQALRHKRKITSMGDKLGQSPTVPRQKSNFYKVLRQGKKAWSHSIISALRHTFQTYEELSTLEAALKIKTDNEPELRNWEGRDHNSAADKQGHQTSETPSRAPVRGRDSSDKASVLRAHILEEGDKNPGQRALPGAGEG